MFVIPAIDLMDGAVVRLKKGDPGSRVVYSRDPGEIAEGFAEGGARHVHVVDLDGALSGHPRNEAAIRAICQSDVQVELGGGLRDLRSIEHALALGLHAVVLGTAAVERLDLVAEAARLFPGRVRVAVDARGGEVAVRGWRAGSGRPVVEVAREVKSAGIDWIEFTDVARDGTFEGPNVRAAADLQQAAGVPIVVAGGVAGLDDVRACAAAGLYGVIVGKAIYEKKLTLADALAAAKA